MRIKDSDEGFGLLNGRGEIVRPLRRIVGPFFGGDVQEAVLQLDTGEKDRRVVYG